MASTSSFANIKGGKIRLSLKYLQNTALTRGRPFLAAWAQRISGVILVLYVWLHIITLSGLENPETFDSKMEVFGLFFFVVLEWLLAVPVIYHSLNGGRIVLYEIFENRKDDITLKWVLVLGMLYLILLGFFMIIGNQQVSVVFFWAYIAVISACITFIAISKIKGSGAPILWKLQRITGLWLLIIVPAHMVFMHLNPAVGHDAQTILSRLNHPFIKMIDLTLLAGVLFHGGYGLYSIGGDYLVSGKAKITAAALVGCISLVLAWTGAKLILLG